jgi:hypothetical protein
MTIQLPLKGDEATDLGRKTFFLLPVLGCRMRQVLVINEYEEVRQ